MGKIPFTIEEFLNVFVKYNQSIYPVQIIMYILGATALFLVLRKNKQSDRIISGILSFMWLWMGIAYHIKFFSVINKAAILFGIFFVIQGLIFFYLGVIKEKIQFHLKKSLSFYLGTLFILYSMTIYPIIGYLTGHGYPYAPCFGVAPCPTTIFTFGLLSWTRNKFPKSILIIPFLWSIVGLSAAINLNIKEDIGILISGISATIVRFASDKKNHKSLKLN
jgi:hypothetical protein